MVEEVSSDLRTLSKPEMRALASVLVERAMFAQRHGLSFNDKRDLYSVLGYARTLLGQDYRARYTRGGLARRIVEVYPKATWRGGLEIFEDENPNVDTPFEQAIKQLNDQLKLWATLRRLDTLAGLSSYAVMLIGAPGDPSTPLPKGKPGGLLYLTLFSGGGGPGSTNVTSAAISADATIDTLVQDPKDKRYGLPATYRLTKLAETSGDFNKPVHWTRILHVAEGCLDNDVYGSPVLEPVWNLLDDLDKITGGGAEAFWLRANQGLHLNIDKDTTLTPEERTALHDQAEEYQHQIRRMLQTRKVSVDVLGSDTANFSSPADAIITQIAGALAIPKRILTGSEMGELASSQDRENWRDQVTGRRTEYAEPNIVRPLIDRLLEFGYLPPLRKEGEYQVEWSHIQALTEQERGAGAANWAGVNATQKTIVFTPEEIRDTWYGLEPLTPEQIAAATPPPPEQASPAPSVPENETPPEEVKPEEEEEVEVDDDEEEVDEEEELDEEGKPIKKPAKKVVKKAVKPAKKEARAAEEYEEAILHALTTAIETNDVDTIDEILGIKHD